MYTIEVNGQTRQFAFFAPLGWEQLIRDEGFSDGLPTITVLHGGGQEPDNFLSKWPWQNHVDATTLFPDKSDRFFLFVPFGASFGKDEQTYRSWVTGWNQSFPLEDGTTNDVDFIEAMHDHMESVLRQRLVSMGSTHTDPFDPARNFLQGYSAGGMMAHRITREIKNRYAAIWVYATAYGGQRFYGESPEVKYGPTRQAGVSDMSCSLYHYHGDDDESVDAGWNSNITNPQTFMQTADKLEAQLALNGITAPVTRGDQPIVKELERYSLYNGTTTRIADTTGLPDRDGGTGSVLRSWRTSIPGMSNPSVDYYADPTGDHTNMATGGNRVFTIADVWAWFKAHPGISLD